MTWTRERPPGPSGLPLLIRALARGNPMAVFEQLARSHPRLAYLRLGPERVFVLSHPDLVHEVFVRRGRAVRKGRTSRRLELLLGTGLLTSEGEAHRQARRIIQPLLHGERVAAYATAILAAVEELDRRWRAGDVVDLAVEFPALTSTVVVRALFGTELPESDVAEVGRCLRVLLEGRPWHLAPGADLLLALPLPANRRRFEAVDRLDALARRLIRRRADAPPGPDLLSTLLRSTDLSDQRLRDETLTLLVAGHETTAGTLCWAWWLLAQHPDVARWLRSEVEAVDPSRTATLARTCTAALPRTRAVVAEALRLYPPSWLLGRRVIRPFDMDGWTLPGGALVVASQWALHRDPRFWEAPGAFRPERWLTDDGAFDPSAPGHPRSAYLPFGLGSRICVGREFALLESVLVLARLVARWQPTTVGADVRPHPSFTLRPHPGLSAVLRPWDVRGG